MTEDESQQSIECKAAIRAALEKVGEYCGLSPMTPVSKVEACNESLKATITAICDCCGTVRIKWDTLQKVNDLVGVIDDPDMFKDVLDKMSPTGSVRTGADTEECREALRVAIVAICRYCGTERLNTHMLSKFGELVLWVEARMVMGSEDIDSFRIELTKLCDPTR